MGQESNQQANKQADSRESVEPLTPRRRPRSSLPQKVQAERKGTAARGRNYLIAAHSSPDWAPDDGTSYQGIAPPSTSTCKTSGCVFECSQTSAAHER